MATSAAGKAAQASGYKTQYFPECSDTHPTMDTVDTFYRFPCHVFSKQGLCDQL